MDSFVDGEKNKCMGARIWQARMETGIEGGTSRFNIVWTCERGTRNGELCDTRGDEWEEMARKAKNKMAGQCQQHKRTFH